MQPKVSIADLPPLVGINGIVPGRKLLEGARFGLEQLTLVLGETPPGRTAPLHRHEYEEIFIIHGGRGSYTVGDATVEAGPGDVVVIPSGVAHGFTNRGQETLYHTAVHGSGWFVQEVLVEPERSSGTP